ncbi:MAG: hypothetical protein RL238_1670 [Actinomycetota bacterium]|jgi:hypothetical protein
MSAVLLAASDGGPVWLLLAGPAAGGGFYYGWWRYYRNTDKSHSFERETKVATKPITGQDTKVDEVRGTKRSSIDGANHTSHRQRVQRVE